MTDDLIGLTPVGELGESGHNFVSNSWVRSRGKQEPSSIDRGMFLKSFPGVVHSIIERGDVLVAHFPDNRDLFIGWIALDREDPSCVHWMYVKGNFRNAGYAKRMLAELGPDVTMSLQPRVKWQREKAAAYGYRYDPYQLFRTGDDHGDHTPQAAVI